MSHEPKTIVVTGGAGFVGSRLCGRLAPRGHRVISVDNYFTGVRGVEVPGVDYREAHTKDIGAVVPERPDTVFHLGEYSRVEASLAEPNVVWDMNVNGTFRVLEYCREKSPYAFTKATNSELVRNYGDWYGLPFAITYFYNVYGPGERAGTYGTLIEIFRQRFLAGEDLPVTSPGTQQRIFTHVDDIVDGLLLIGEHGEGDEFGLGAAESFSILEIAEMFGSPIVMQPEARGNRMTAKLDVTKSTALGWSATNSVRGYIAQIVAGES